VTDLTPEHQHEKWRAKQHKTRSTEKRLAYRTIVTEDGTKITTPHLFAHVIDAQEAVRNHPAEWSFEPPEKRRPESSPMTSEIAQEAETPIAPGGAI
jgi:hypothetical protein